MESHYGYKMGARPSEYDLRELRSKAACRDTTENWWQADPPIYEDIRKAQAVCAGCPVRELCFRTAELYASEAPLWGVWGGELWWWHRPHWRGRVIPEESLERWCNHNAKLGVWSEKTTREYKKSGKYVGEWHIQEAKRREKAGVSDG